MGGPFSKDYVINKVNEETFGGIIVEAAVKTLSHIFFSNDCEIV